MAGSAGVESPRLGTLPRGACPCRPHPGSRAPLPRRALTAFLAIALLSAQGTLAAQAAASDDTQELPQECPQGTIRLQGTYWVPRGGVRFEGDCELIGDPGALVIGAVGAQVAAGGDLKLGGTLSFTAGGLLVSLKGSLIQLAEARVDLQGWRMSSPMRHVGISGSLSVITTGPSPALSARGSVIVAGSASFWQLSGAAISASVVIIEGEADFSSIVSSVGAINAGGIDGGHVNISGVARFDTVKSSTSGGAISVNASRGGWVDIPGTATFVDCASDVSGGAIAAGSVRISGSVRFDGCSALVGGGAISSGGGAALRSLAITGTAQFTRCTAVFGSAVASSQEVEISGFAKFSDLECQPRSNLSAAGSILFLQPGSSAFLSGLLVENVSCGTAIWAQAVTDLTLTDSFFSHISQGAGSPMINADNAGHVNISHCASWDIQSFLFAQNTHGIYIDNVDIDGCGTNVRPDLPCVDVSTEVNGKGAVSMLRFRPGPLPAYEDVALSQAPAGRRTYTLYRGEGTVDVGDDRSDITAYCPPGSYPTWIVKNSEAFSANTSSDCSFSQPEGCCMLHFNGWGICKRGKYKGVTECTQSCMCLASEMLADHGCRCNTCKTYAPRYSHDLACSPCPDGHISMTTAVMNTNDKRDVGTYSNNTCISCSRAFDDHGDLDFDCWGAGIEVPAGVMVMKESVARAALKAAQANVSCAGGICAFHCSNPSACLLSRTLHADKTGGALKSMCAGGYNDSFPGCSQCATDFGRATYDPFVCKRCGKPWMEWVYWLLAPLIPFGLGMRSASGLGDGGETTNEEREARRIRVGMANSILKILISFCVVCNVVFQSLQATKLYTNTSEWLRQFVGFVDRSVSAASLLSTSNDCLLGGPTTPIWQWLSLEFASIVAMFLFVFLVYMLPGLVTDIRRARELGSELSTPVMVDSPFHSRSRHFANWRSGADMVAASLPGRRVRSLEDKADGGSAAGDDAAPLALEEEYARPDSIHTAPPVLAAAGWRGGCFWRRFIRTTVVLGNTMLPPLAGGFVRFLPCVQVQHGTERSFSAYGLEEPCYFQFVPAWNRLLGGLFGLLLCMAAGPVYWCFLLGLQFRIVRQDPLTDRADHKLIGYLTKHYRHGTKWWEVTVLVRKFVLIVAVAIVPASYSPELHLHIPLVTIIVALVAHVGIRPYVDDTINLIETVSLSISLVLILLSGWIMYPSWNEPLWVMYGILFLVLLLMSATASTLAYLYVKASLGPEGICRAIRRGVEVVCAFPGNCYRFAAWVGRKSYEAAQVVGRWLRRAPHRAAEAAQVVGRWLRRAAGHVAEALNSAKESCRACALGLAGRCSALCCALAAPFRAVGRACCRCVECLRGRRSFASGDSVCSSHEAPFAGPLAACEVSETSSGNA